MLILVKNLFISGQIKKKVVGLTPRHRRHHSGRSPGNSSTAVHDDDHDDGVQQDLSDLLRAEYNCKCAASCAFEVVLITAACTCLKM